MTEESLPQSENSIFAKLIIQFNDNLESLRDFVEMVSGALEKNWKDELSADPTGFIPYLLGFSEMNPDLLELNEDKKKNLGSNLGKRLNLNFKEMMIVEKRALSSKLVKGDKKDFMMPCCALKKQRRGKDTYTTAP